MNAFIVVGLLFASMPASTAKLEVATGDWSNIPRLESRNSEDSIAPEAVERIHELIRNKECVIPGQSRKRLDLTVQFLVHYDPEGRVDRVVLRRLGCEKIESLLGSVLLNFAEANKYRASGQNQAGWYRSEFSLTSS